MVRGSLPASPAKVWSSSSMNGTIDPTAPQHPFVGCINNSIALHSTIYLMVGVFILPDVDDHDRIGSGDQRALRRGAKDDDATGRSCPAIPQYFCSCASRAGCSVGHTSNFVRSPTRRCSTQADVSRKVARLRIASKGSKRIFQFIACSFSAHSYSRICTTSSQINLSTNKSDDCVHVACFEDF